MKYISTKSILYLIIGFTCAGPLAIYRFRHPDKTETRLFFDMMQGKPWKDLFNSTSEAEDLAKQPE